MTHDYARTASSSVPFVGLSISRVALRAKFEHLASAVIADVSEPTMYGAKAFRTKYGSDGLRVKRRNAVRGLILRGARI